MRGSKATNWWGGGGGLGGDVPLPVQRNVCIWNTKKQFLMHILGKDY